MVIKEAQRSFTYFHLYGYPADLVVCNRVLPEDTGVYFGAWREAQQRYRPLVDEAFAPVPVRSAPFFDEEVVGDRMLRRLGEIIFGDDDPTAFFYRGRPYTVRREGERFVLELELPFVEKDDVQLTRIGDELIVRVGSWRRNLILPRVLVDVPTGTAGFEADTLRIEFDPSAATADDRPGAEPAERTGATNHG